MIGSGVYVHNRSKAMQPWEEMSTNLLGKFWACEFPPEEVSDILTTWSQNEPETNAGKAYACAIGKVLLDAPLFPGFPESQKTLAMDLLRLLAASQHPRQCACWLMLTSAEAMQHARTAVAIPSKHNDIDGTDSPRSVDLFPVLFEDCNKSARETCKSDSDSSIGHAGCIRRNAAGSYSKDVPFAGGDISGSRSKNALVMDGSDDAGLSTAYTSPNLPNNLSNSPLTPGPDCFLTPAPELTVLNLGLPSALQSESSNNLHVIVEMTSKVLNKPTAPREDHPPFAQLDAELRRENAEACVEMNTTSKSSDDENAWAWSSPFTKPSGRSKDSGYVDLDLAASREDAVTEFMRGRSQLLLTSLEEWEGETSQRLRYVVCNLFATKIQAAWRGHLLRREFAVPLAAAVMVDRVVDRIWGSFPEQARCQVCMRLRNRAIDELRRELSHHKKMSWITGYQTSIASLQMTIENLRTDQVHQVNAARILQAWWRALLENPTPIMRRFWLTMQRISRMTSSSFEG
jgi:hypothetical protein